MGNPFRLGSNFRRGVVDAPLQRMSSFFQVGIAFRALRKLRPERRFVVPAATTLFRLSAAGLGFGERVGLKKLPLGIERIGADSRRELRNRLAWVEKADRQDGVAPVQTFQ